MARHTAGNRVDGVGDFDAVVLEQRAKVGELTLGLGLGQTEARHEDDLLCVDELDGQIAQLDKEPRLGEYAGLVALSDAIADIKAILSGQRHVHQFFYLDFVTSNQVELDTETTLPLLDEYSNLLVVQTMSKSRALAGMRVGFAFGSENLIQGLNCVKNSINSYTIDQLAILAGVAAVEDGDYFAQRCAQVAATRDQTSETLRELGFTVLPSKSNFIFITHPELPARKLFADLREAGILVRYFALPRIDNFLRVTIGSEEEMAEFCATMKRFVENVL